MYIDLKRNGEKGRTGRGAAVPDSFSTELCTQKLFVKLLAVCLKYWWLLPYLRCFVSFMNMSSSGQLSVNFHSLFWKVEEKSNPPPQKKFLQRFEKNEDYILPKTRNLTIFWWIIWNDWFWCSKFCKWHSVQNSRHTYPCVSSHLARRLAGLAA